MRLLTLVLRRSFARQRGHDEKSDPPWITSIVRCARILATVAALYGLGRVWGLDVFAYASDRLGESVARMVIDVAIILLLAYVVWEIIRAIIRSESAGDPVDPDEPEISFEEGSMKPQTRMQTFLPLVEKFLFVLVLIVAGMMILKTLGVDTGPLLAGAGIIGIAIGFGAQTLVKDIVSGIFFLLDDAFRLGEYVEIDQTRGTVEGISIRSLRIRHHRGAVHTVPFGTIQRLTNYSRDWIILKLEFLLAFETDLKKVKKIVKDIGKELMEDEEYGQHFLEPVKSQGVRRMEQIGMVDRREVHGQARRAVHPAPRGVSAGPRRLREERHRLRPPAGRRAGAQRQDVAGGIGGHRGGRRGGRRHAPASSAGAEAGRRHQEGQLGRRVGRGRERRRGWRVRPRHMEDTDAERTRAAARADADAPDPGSRTVARHSAEPAGHSGSDTRAGHSVPGADSRHAARRRPAASRAAGLTCPISAGSSRPRPPSCR